MTQLPAKFHLRFLHAMLVLIAVLCSGCGGGDNSAVPAHGKISADGFRDLDWMEMLPRDEVQAAKNTAPIDHSGSMRAQQVGTYNTIAALDGSKVRVAGYIVPLEADDKGNLTEFFLVPYFGACIHVPPPPPNQIIYVKLDKGVEAPEIMDPYGVKGVLRVRKVANDVAGSAYTLEQATISPWEG